MAHDTTRQPLHLRLPAVPESAELMRERLRGWFDEVGLDEMLAFDVVTAGSEAFANAIEHPVEPARAAVDVEAELDGQAVVLKVRNHGHWRANGSRPSEPDHFGFSLMRALSDSVEVKSPGTGTVVTLRRDF
jgi:anti-sigma regulatory factor (Ser/Thr protein kinase)